MRRMARKGVAALGAGLAALGLVGGFAGPAQAAEADLSPIATATFEDLAACMQVPDAQLNVLYLLDASSSLEEDTDPQRLRGKILGQAIKQLGGLATERDVYYAVSSFDLGYRERKPWTQLTAEGADSAAQWAESQYDWWGAGLGTDWKSALAGGQATMQASPKAKQACKMIVWVTDGGINVNGNKLDYAANIAAMEEICGTNPVSGQLTGEPAIVDAIRSSGTHLVAVALASQEFLETLPADDRLDEESKFSYLIPVSEGSGTVSNAGLTGEAGESFTYACGKDPIPAGWAKGAFVLGNSPIALAFQFSGIVDRIRGGTPLGGDIDVPGTFEVEPGINRVTIQLAGTEWSITSPDGSAVASSAMPSQGPSVQVTAQGELVSIQIDEPTLKPGTWRIDVTDPKAPARVFVYALLSGTTKIPELRVGDVGEFTIDIISDITGEPVERADYQAQPISVTAGVPGNTAEPLTCTEDPALLRYTCAITPTAVGSTEIKATLEVNSFKDSPLYRFQGTFTEQVAPQAAYPQVLPDQVSLTALDGRRGAATGQITIQGPVEGAGEVCLPSADSLSITQDVVDRTDTYVFGGSAWGSCVAVGQGETVEVSMEVRNEVPATGTVLGAFTVELKSSQSDAVVTQQVTFTFDTIRQGTPPPWLVAALILLGLALPILLLYLQARSSSKLVLRGLQMATVPVLLEFSPGYVTVARAKPAGGQMLTLEDWTWPSGTSGRRSFPCGGGVTLRAVMPKNPLGAITARAQASTGVRVVSCRGSMKHGTWAPTGLNPAGEWFISAAIGDLADQQKSQVEGTLIAFVNPGMTDLGERSMEMSGDVQARFLSQDWVEIRDAAQRVAQAKPSRDRSKGETEPAGTGGIWSDPEPWGTPSTSPPAAPPSEPTPKPQGGGAPPAPPPVPPSTGGSGSAWD